MEGELAHLNGTVMEDVPEPRECSVLVALVEKLDLLSNDVLSLRTSVLVEVHRQARPCLSLTLCRSRVDDGG